ERDYGVVLGDGEVDELATKQLRARNKPVACHFHFGPERDCYEAQWTPAAYDRLHAVLDALPIHWRFFAKTEIFRRMKGRSGADGVQAAFDAVCERFPELPRPRPVREAAE
ncbi:MAG: hydantoin utilization protein B, partial [Mesorhizobium sp.]